MILFKLSKLSVSSVTSVIAILSFVALAFTPKSFAFESFIFCTISANNPFLSFADISISTVYVTFS